MPATRRLIAPVVHARGRARAPLAAPLTAAVVGLLVGVLALAGLALAPPATAEDAGTAPLPPAGHPWYGPGLDIEVDTPASYTERLGTAPSLYTFPIDLPLTEEGTTQLRTFAAQAAEQGAVLVLEVEPTVPVEELVAADAQALAGLVAELHGELDTFFLVRFAAEPNASWRPWGQQPTRWITAYRMVADAVHDATGADGAAMVWSPVYGSGYPFRLGDGADSEIDLRGQRELAPLDTNSNGKHGRGDDPYGPYWPGTEYVDWVGLYLYRFGQSQGVERNQKPAADEMEQRLADVWGYPGRSTAPFYERFAVHYDKPLLLETSAFWNPTVPGARELALKRAWWQQVFASLADHPRIAAVSWLEWNRPEPEVEEVPVDWRATVTPRMASDLLADLRRYALTLGAVTTPHTAAEQAAEQEATSRPPRTIGPVLTLAPNRAGALLGAGLAGVLLLLAAAGLRRPRFDPGEGRDPRLDLVRGVLMLGLLGAALALALDGPGALLAAARAAASVGGMDSFLLLAGLGAGLASVRLADGMDGSAVVSRRLQQGLGVAILTGVTSVVVYFATAIPGADRSVVGTVPGGTADLYAGGQHLVDYPLPAWVLADLATGRFGTWLLVPMAPIAVLLLLTGPLMSLLRRGLWWLVIGASLALYVGGLHQGWRLLPSWSESSFPLAVWQLPFVLGLLAAAQRRRVTAWLRRPLGVALLVTGTSLYVLVCLLAAAPAATPDLSPGRIAATALLAALGTAALGAWWGPVAAGPGRLLVPLGRTGLLGALVLPLGVALAATLDVHGVPVGVAQGVAAALLVVAWWAWGRRRVRD